MSAHHRNHQSERDALYQPLPQAEDQVSEIQLGEDDEAEVTEDFVTHEHLASSDNRVGWIHFILGCAVLLPWNGTLPALHHVWMRTQIDISTLALITATPYFVSRLEGSSLKPTFSSYLSTTFTVANFLFLAHATASQSQVRICSPSRHLSYSLNCT